MLATTITDELGAQRLTCTVYSTGCTATRIAEAPGSAIDFNYTLLYLIDDRPQGPDVMALATDIAVMSLLSHRSPFLPG